MTVPIENLMLLYSMRPVSMFLRNRRLVFLRSLPQKDAQLFFITYVSLTEVPRANTQGDQNYIDPSNNVNMWD